VCVCVSVCVSVCVCVCVCVCACVVCVCVIIAMGSGGGVLERVKAAELSDLLNLHISDKQVVVCHSPIQELVPQYQDRRVSIARATAVSLSYCMACGAVTRGATANITRWRCEQHEAMW
jgi:hypothetical protein